MASRSSETAPRTGEDVASASTGFAGGASLRERNGAGTPRPAAPRPADRRAGTRGRRAGTRGALRAPLLALALALGVAIGPACRLHLSAVEHGGTWTPAQAEALASGVGVDRGAVLAALGPPDVVTYTLSEEVLVYRRAGHRGSDVRFLIPDPGLNLARPGLETLGPELDTPEGRSGEAPPIALMHALVETLFGLLNPVSSEEAVALHARTLRWDVVRIVLDRESLAVRAVEIHRGVGDADARRVARGAFLLGDA